MGTPSHPHFTCILLKANPMVRRLILAGSLLLAPGISLFAQAPRITPAGDPSIRADTIYALVVKAEDYRDQDAVLLLQDGVLQIERNGVTRRTLRTVTQVLKQDGAAEWGEWKLRYRPDRERITLNWARVLRPDGTVLSARPEVDRTTQESRDENQAYSGLMVRQLTLGGITAGTLVDVSYTIETFRPTLAGDIYQRWFVNRLTPIRRARFIVDAPAHQPITIATPNLTIKPTVVEQGGRRVHTWTAQEIPAIKMEPFAGYPNSVYQQILVWGWTGWAQVGDWFARLMQGRDATAPAVDRAFSAAAGGIKDPDSLLIAAQRWIAQDFRYVSIGLGDGNYQPRAPTDVVETRFGDCKDKATLFIALAHSLGYQAYPVLVNTVGLMDSTPVSLERFNHMIVALDRDHDGEFTFLDLTNDLLPFGDIPQSLQGSYGLLVRPGGRSSWIQLPESRLADNWVETLISGAIGSDAVFSGTLEVRAAGTAQYWLRDRLRGRARSGGEAMIEAARDIAARYLPGAVVDSTELNDGLSLTRTPYIWVKANSDHLVQPSGARYLLQLPPRYIDAPSLLADLGEEPRNFPIDAGRLNDASTARLTIQLTLPPGWRAELPPPVVASSVFGEYRATYTQKGRTLRISRELSGRSGNEPPDSVAALRRWLRAVADDRTQSILLDPSGNGYRPDSAELFVAPTGDTATIAVHFDWPADTDAQVFSENLEIDQKVDGAADTTRSTMSYRVTVRDHPDGHFIGLNDWEGDGWGTDEPADTTGDAIYERLSSKLPADFTPGFVVTDDGKVLRIEGIDVLREMLDSVVRPKFDTMPKKTEGARQFLERMLSEEYLTSKVEDEWNPLVYTWSDLVLEVGAVYERDTERPSPLFPDQLIPWHVEDGLLSRVPCEVWEADSACILLVMRSVPDSKVLTPMVIKMVREVTTLPDSEIQGWHLDMEIVVRLVTEPATLTPHRLETRRDLILTGPGGVNEPGYQHRVMVKRLTFTHRWNAPEPVVDGRRLQLATDSFRVYHVEGADTTKAGFVTDRLRADGDRLIRIYRQTDTSGAFVDSVVANRDDLAPRMIGNHGPGFGANVRFDSDSAFGWYQEESDSTHYRVAIPSPVYASDFFDSIVRASDLTDSTRLATRVLDIWGKLSPAEGRVIRSEKIRGHECWVFAGHNGGMEVTFWIDKSTRTLRRSFLHWGDSGILLEGVR